jgi:hypothetical protein
VKYILNFKSFTLLYFIGVLLFINYDLIMIESISKVLNLFTLKELKNISLANIGIFASLTGFLIAAIPFLVGVIVNASYLITAVNNNLTIITSTLKVIFFLFVLSLITLFIDIESLNIDFKIGLISLFIYLYLVLLYSIYEIINILKVFVSDLTELKKNMEVKNENTELLKEILKKLNQKN